MQSIASQGTGSPQSVIDALDAGMTVVVQPNVSRMDFRLGIQTGEPMLITADGAERLHRFPRVIQFLPSAER